MALNQSSNQRDAASQTSLKTLQADKSADETLSDIEIRFLRSLALIPGEDFGVNLAAELSDIDFPQTQNLLVSLVAAGLLNQRENNRYELSEQARTTFSADRSMEIEQAVITKIFAWYLTNAYNATRKLDDLRIFPVPALDAPRYSDQIDNYYSAQEWYRIEWNSLFRVIQLADNLLANKAVWQLALFVRSYSSASSADDKATIFDIGLSAAQRDGNQWATTKLRYYQAVATNTSFTEESLTAYHVAIADFHEQGEFRDEVQCRNLLGVEYLVDRQFSQAIEQFNGALELTREHDYPEYESIVLFNLSDCYGCIGQFDEALAAAKDSVTKARQGESKWTYFTALVYLARAQSNAGSLDEALLTSQDALSLDEGRGYGWALLEHVRIQRLAGKFSDALTTAQQAVEFHNQRNPTYRTALSWTEAGLAAAGLDQFDQALDHHQKALEIVRDTNARWELGIILDNYGQSLAALGKREQALESWREAVDVFAKFDDYEARTLLDDVTARISV